MMPVTRAQRAALFTQLSDLLGRDQAEALMDQLPPIAWDQIATKSDLRESEVTILAELVKTNQAMLKTNQAMLKTNQAMVDLKGEMQTELVKTNQAMVDLKSEMQTELVKTNQAVVDLKGEMQTGFARLERRISWYLVAVAAMIVGFGLTVWLSLMSAVRMQDSSAAHDPTAITATVDTSDINPI